MSVLLWLLACGGCRLVARVPPSPPAPAQQPLTMWATSAFSPRYARNKRPAGVSPAAEKALGPPQLKQKHRCGMNVAIAWVPTMARPRKLEVFYNQSVVLFQVDAVVVVVVNVGSQRPALASLDLQLDDGSFLTVFKATAASPQPTCLAENTYAVPAALRTGPAASRRVVGVRLHPTQARVKSKQELMQVGGWVV